MSFYYLEVTTGLHTGRRFALPDGAISIGRAAQNTIALANEKSISGHHAIIYKSPERMLFQDLQSTNGSFVNEQHAEEILLIPGDCIGFGKSGPRLKLIQSDRELPLSDTIATRSSANADTTAKIRQPDTPIAMMSSEATSKEDQDTIYKLKHSSLPAFDTLNPSKTMEYEQKLLNKNINSKEMQNLMNDDKRIDKILKQGNLGSTQSNMLQTVHNAHKSMRRQWYYVILSTICISVCISAFFAIRAFQYKQIISRAKLIKNDLDYYEKRITSAKANPEKNEAELKQLIAELESKQKTLSTIKNKIDVDDFGKFYTDPLEQRIDRVLMRFGESDYHIPQEMKERVQHHIDVYSGRMKGTITRYFKRKEKYFPMILQIFNEKNLPVDLAYVSMLESGFNPMALSHAGARGLWQFMPQTGRRYGLKVTDQIDDRTDPLKATYAAAEYFKELIGMFGGKSAVMLCMAAYNAGEGRIMGALRKIEDPMRNRDFWYVYRMGYLAEETNEYIPRVIALIILSEYENEYGFGNAIQQDTTPQLNEERDFLEVFKVE